MNKPTRRSITELQQKNFVDFLYETYEREKNSAGDCYATPLEYITDEKTYLSSNTEKEFVEEYGFAPIGFLEALRVQMAKTSGFGICVNNNDLKKTLAGMMIDYKIDYEELQKFYELLVEYQFIIFISDSNGNQYATTPQQVFNWEYRMWSRLSNNKSQKKSRSEAKKTEKQEKDKEAEVETVMEDVPTEPMITINKVPAETPIIPELEETFETFEKSFGADNKDFF